MKWKLGEDYRDLLEEIAELDDEVRHCWSRLTAPTAKIGVRSRKNITDALGDGVAYVMDIETELNKKIERLKGFRLEIEETIDSFSGSQRRLLRMRYIRGFSWQQIAMRLYCDESTCRRMHRKIVRELSKEDGS